MPPPLPEEKKMHIFILAGGSNMVGRGDPSAEDLRPHPNVFKYSARDRQWTPAVDSLHDDGRGATVRVGPGKSFGVALSEYYSSTIQKRRNHLNRKSSLQALVQEKQRKLAAIDRSVAETLRKRCPDIEVILSKGVVRLKKRFDSLRR